MNRAHRLIRWLVIAGASGLLTGLVMRCDKAALNFQQGLFEGLGQEASGLIADQTLPGA